MKTHCKSCNAEIYWLKQQKPDGTISPKPNPIDAERNEKGNLIMSKDGSRYKVATEDERRDYRRWGINLFISHFATCKYAETHRAEAQEKAVMLGKRKARDKAMEALHGPVKK